MIEFECANCGDFAEFDKGEDGRLYLWKECGCGEFKFKKESSKQSTIQPGLYDPDEPF